MPGIDHREPVNSPGAGFRAGGGWVRKFQRAGRGLVIGILDRGRRPWHNSFLVHLPAAALVLAAAWVRQLDAASLGVLILSIGLVLTTELVNGSLEHLARAVTDQPHPEIRDALDIAAGAVLLASLTAAAAGLWLLL